LITFGGERARVYAVLLILLVGFLSVLMVSTIRFSSFKTVGTNARSMRVIILCLAVGMLIFLYSEYVLLGIVVAYILYGLLARVFSAFWRRGETADTKVDPHPIRHSDN
jgi:CDP-diacylglycerol--serine O-phosphatidyltransferase